ncbi:MAG: DNA helicase PcrA [Clostridiales bacterium]|nr:DNA helicase PcrA [Clostridiales bacterium]
MNLLEGLNDEQRTAVMATEGPLLILAGAGSGKTRVLTHRTAYLIAEKGVKPYNILAITFTNKAAGEMRERIDRLVGMGSESIWVSTFHSACVRILRRYIDRIGYGNNFTIYDSDDQKNIMKSICKRLEIDTKIHKEKSFLAAISAAKDEMVGVDEFEARAAGDYTKRRQAQVYREYQNTLKNCNALDFDDLLLRTVELFRADSEVLESYQERFKYIMVDEYQDTNTVQFELVRLLAGKYRNLCVVGDDDQSIYKFRGANIYNILHFEQHFPDATVVKLEQNYRSTQNILDAANAVIANNTGRKEKRLWTDNGTGDRVRLVQAENGYEEADYVARDIESGVRTGKYRYGDCAVLYRTNAQSRLFEERFIVSNIPYRIVGGVNFYARKEIKDLLCYLKTIDNGSDDLAVRRIINVPKRGIGNTTVGRVDAWAQQEGLGFFEALRRADEIPGLGKAAARIDSFVLVVEAMRAKAKMLSVPELLTEVIDMTGYRDGLKAEGTEEAMSRIENIDELLTKAVDYDQGADEPTLGGFLEEVALVADIDSLEEDNDYVVLMTLHSAKGLEFENVYMTGMEEGLFPSYISIQAENPDAEVEEERRLAYVGITRARENLTLSCAKSRMLRGETRRNAVSRFVREIPPELLDGEIREREEPAFSERLLRKEESTFQKARKEFRSTPIYMEVGAQRDFGSAKLAGGELTYGVGDRVRHIKFGDGEVKAIVSGGRDFEVTVDFDRAGTKKMFASFAKLKKI